MDKKKLRFLFPLIHFLASFGYERLLFLFNEFDSMYTEALYPEVISDKTEYILTYIVTKLFAGVFICLLWQLVFLIVDRKIPRKVFATFAVIFCLGVVVGLLVWPECYGISIDNYITYYYALRFIPFYWHHMFTGCIYGAMMMVIPVTAAIALLQWLFLVWTVGYLFFRIYKSSRFKKNTEWFALGLLLLPEFFEVAVNPYRNVLYTILCINFFTVITMDALDKVSLDKGRIIYLVSVGSIVTLWRSEGLVLGVLGVLAAVFAGYRANLKKAAFAIAIFAACVFVIGRPQKIGNAKYYGNDYLIVSSIRPIQYILNSEYSNLTYDGAGEDIAAVEAIVPLNVLKQWGLYGYVSNNRAQGREDIDQSFASKEEKSRFIKAYVRLGIHNIKPCLVSQLNYFYKAMGIDFQYYAPEYRGEDTGMPEYRLAAWDKGMQEFSQNASMGAWQNSSLRTAGYNIFAQIRDKYIVFLDAVGLSVFAHVAMLALTIALLIREFVNVIRKKYDKLFLGLMLLVWLLELGVIIVGMPFSYSLYLYPFFFTVTVLEFMYFAVTSCDETPTEKSPQLS